MKFLQQIFRRYLQNQSPVQEQELVNRWYEATGNTSRPSWMDDDHLKKTKEETWQKISPRLGLTLSPQLTVGHTIKWRSLVRYATAALVIGAGAWGMLKWLMPAQSGKMPLQAVMELYSTAQGARQHVQLPDGTEIWLNNASSLQVRKPAAGDSTREVWLNEGEAYFKVAKNPHKPFIVHVDALQTRVLGTAFNITAYRQLANLQVGVTEGKVQVSTGTKILDTLTRNRQLSYQPGNDRYSTFPKNMSPSNGWWAHRFVLENATFNELALRMKLRYKVTITSSNQRILATAFTANFPEQVPLENILAALCTLYSTHYSVNKNNVIIY